MSQNFPRKPSVPASMEDEILDKEMDKIFHDEKETLSKLNPSAGELDEERKNYYRSASSDDAASAEKQFASPAPAEAEPLTDQGYRHAGSDGFVSEHSNEDFKHKKSSAGGKHRKSTDSGMKKASTAGAQLQGIPEKEQETGAEEESKSNFPWKVDRSDEPVVYTEENEEKDDDDEKNKQSSGVKFSIGFNDEDTNEIVDEDEEEHFKEKGHKQNRHKKKTSRHQDKFERRPSENFVNLADESGNLQEADLEEIAGHRFEKTKGGAVSKISHNKRSMIKIGREDVEMVGKDMKMMSRLGYGFKSELDHTPHALFIEMDELEGEEWEERARWIKYEEDLEAERGEWGKPHVSSLTFHSLINLRLCIEAGTFLLDIAVNDLPSLVHRVVEDLSEKDIINEELKEKVLRVLLFRHKHVHPHETFRFGLKRSLSQKSIQSLVEDAAKSRKFSTKPEHEKQGSLNSMENGVNGKDKQNLMDSNGLQRSQTASSSFRRIDSMDSMIKAARKTNILSCMEEGTEGAVVLVGALDEIEKPVVAFVRLAEAIIMPNTIEMSLPVRFIFILLTPKRDLNMDPHEIGRSFSTLMSNPSFAFVAYSVEEKHELLHAINTFLDDSVVLPPGDWDKKHMMGMKEIKEMRQRRTDRKNLRDGIIPVRDPISGKEKKDEKDDDDGGPPKRNPMERTSVPFGGLIDDMKSRYPKYLSDFKDGLNAQCLAAIIFIYFACLSGGVAFGGLMAEKTKDAIGISETLIISCVAGIFYSLFSGCPLIIIGSTGPVLLFDEALFNFSDSNMPGQFLYWRTWVGIWTFIISLVVAGFQGSTLVKYFTRFIKDIFASLISLVFIYEAVKKLSKIFNAHPLHGATDYCDHYDSLDCVRRPNTSIFVNMTHDDANNTYCDALPVAERGPQPNTALLSAILMFGCFFIAYFLRLFRNSQYLGRNARKAMGDFGVPIAIVIMVLLDYSAGDTYTEKLKVPEGLDVTDPSQRGWFINPLGKDNDLAVWAMFAGFLPALLLYLLLFIETHICELIMMDKTKDEKGAGLHLDIVILSLINLGCGLFGGPWICAATVRAVAHVSALTVFSASAIPGESPKAIGVRDQRVTFLVVSIMLGVSIVLAPVLKQVPFAVLFGVFLYMGVSGMNGIQWWDRMLLCLMPIKHHPSVTYVKRVRTWRMVLFTFLQALGLGLLWYIKSSPAALAFPIFVVMMIPYRWSMKFIFTENELDALDGPTSGQNYDKDDDDEEEDFYEAANAVPTAQPTQIIHKSLIGIVSLSQAIGTGAIKQTETQKN